MKWLEVTYNKEVFRELRRSQTLMDDLADKGFIVNGTKAIEQINHNDGSITFKQ